jgi:hypothetical protein
MATLDLRPYGIEWTLTSESNLSEITADEISFGVFYNNYVKSQARFELNDVEYKNLREIGSGSYGTIYGGTGPDGKEYAIKHIKNVKSGVDLTDMLKEVIQQIIVSNATEGLPNGPFAPKLHLCAYNEYINEAFIVSDVMENTVWNLISAQTHDENDASIPYILEQASIQLRTLQDLLQFNHRDLKTNNIMYKTNADGTLNIKMIDFGYTCLTWNGLFISGGDYFRTSTTCLRPTRDISQLITSMLWFHAQYISTKMKNRLKSLIKAEHKQKGQTKNLTKFMKHWSNSYKLLNTNNVHIESGTPKIVFDEMKRFVEGKKFIGTHTRKRIPKKPNITAAAPSPNTVCPPEKIYNTKTRRCVLRRGAVGRKLAKEFAAPAVPAVPAAAPPAPAADDCPPGKIRNPKTRRCVKRDGAIGKKLEVL